MNKSIALLATLLIAAGLALPAQAENAVKADMKTMGKSYRAAAEAKDAPTLKTELTTLRSAAVQAQTQIPNDLKTQAADNPDRKLYAEGINKVLGEIDATLALLNAGKLQEAQTATLRIKTLQREYHKKLGV